MLVTLVLIALTWGTFTFGAVYPWGYWPLAALAAVIGVIGLRRSRPLAVPIRSLVVAWGVLLGAIGLQCIPLPSRIIEILSPETDALLRTYAVGYAAARAGGTPAWHPLSIAPAATWRGGALLASFALMSLGLTKGLTRTEGRHVAVGIAVVGTALAFVGIIQRATYNGAIYGFWIPEPGRLPFGPGGGPFGPFVNRNHFAGWMLLGLPVALGMLLSGLVRPVASPAPRPDWRTVILSGLSSSRAKLVVTFAAVQCMGLSLALTLSRSGLACFVVAMTLAAATIAEARLNRTVRIVAGVTIAVTVIVSIGIGGLQAVADRLPPLIADFGRRQAAWNDAVSIFKRFPAVGTGFNTYGIATLFYQTTSRVVHYAEAHSDYVQLAAEGGVLLTAAVLLLVAIYAVHIRRVARLDEPGSRTRWIRLGAITALIAIGLQEAVEFSLQIPGDAALCAVVLALAARPSSRGR